MARCDTKYFMAIFVFVFIFPSTQTTILNNAMEGALWKWTNYWNGWQVRWFVLDEGILAYYKSQDDVNSGCKGSIKVSTCEIDVPANDMTRLTISIPGEQHMYLRAPSSQERQQWLVALGSAKACVNTAKTRVDSGGDNVDSLKSKKAELRLYCDLLTQQAHQVKESVATSPPDVSKLTEGIGLLSLTCDTFTRTLDECIQLVDKNLRYEYPHQHATDVGLPRGHHTKTKPTVPSIKRSSSYETSERKT